MVYCHRRWQKKMGAAWCWLKSTLAETLDLLLRYGFYRRYERVSSPVGAVAVGPSLTSRRSFNLINSGAATNMEE